MYRLSLQYHDDSFDNEAQVAFKWYGCNMRALDEVLRYREEQSFKADLRGKIYSLDLSDVQVILGCDYPDSEHTSPSIIQTSCPNQPKPEHERHIRSDTKERSISSLAVWEALHGRFGKSLFDQESLLPRTAPAAGMSHPHLEWRSLYSTPSESQRKSSRS